MIGRYLLFVLCLAFPYIAVALGLCCLAIGIIQCINAHSIDLIVLYPLFFGLAGAMFGLASVYRIVAHID